MIFNHSPHKIIIWAVIAILFECEWEKEVADHGDVSANASRPEVLMVSNFYTKFFGQLDTHVCVGFVGI